MATIECYNCKMTTNAVAPRYRCSYCNYPLAKYIQISAKPQPEEKVIKNIKEADHSGPGPGGPKKSKPSIADTILSKIKWRREAAKADADRQAENGETDQSTELPDVARETTERSEPVIDVPDALEKVISSITDRDDEPKPAQESRPKRARRFAEVKPVLKENHNPEKTGRVVAGWLVVHTEGKPAATYELFEGDNVIGRPDGPHHVDVEIENDRFVSRVHCIIRITKDFLHRFHYRLVDNGKSRQGKPSTNGTYVNGKTDRLPHTSALFLADGDIVQVGETKLVFKSVNEADSFTDAAQHVGATDYTATVVIR